jgi:hypothetical protein
MYEMKIPSFMKVLPALGQTFNNLHIPVLYIMLFSAYWYRNKNISLWK